VELTNARDSAGTHTGQTRIVSCGRLVSRIIYAIWGLRPLPPINPISVRGKSQRDFSAKS
jgi:hypothetical protein